MQIHLASINKIALDPFGVGYEGKVTYKIID